MTIDDALAAIPRLSALVVGDVCLDRWCRYDPAFAEPSRETGIPRIAVTAVEISPGAAGTVASNLAALGTGRIAVIGVAGDDGHGQELRRALEDRGIEHAALVTAPDCLTFTYTKLINSVTGIEDLPRVDYIRDRDLPPEVQSSLIDRFRELAPVFDVIIVSDQAEIDVGGAVTAALREAICEFAGENSGKLVWVDSRARGERFHHVLLKLNMDEAEAACRRIGAPGNCEALWRHIGGPALIVTRGPQGAVIYDQRGVTAEPARRIENPVDICGAGDSFNAAAALMLALTRDISAAVRFGNLAASVSIMKSGTGTATPAEILAAAGNVKSPLVL